MNSLIKMEKNKNLLIFTNVNFPYKISYDLNTGEYQRISENGTKKIKTIKPFFANVYYLNIITKIYIGIPKKKIYRVLMQEKQKNWNHGKNFVPMGI